MTFYEMPPRLRTDPLRRLSRFFLCGSLILASANGAAALSTKDVMPEFLGIKDWIGTDPLSRKDFEGKITLVFFWDYACLECAEDAVILNQWYYKYSMDAFDIVGVHTPQFEFEKNLDYVKRAVKKLGIKYPIAADLDSRLWNLYNNLGRPSYYFIDTRGRIRYVESGGQDYAKWEKMLQDLFKESGRASKEKISTQAAPQKDSQTTASLYLGSRRLSGFGNREPVRSDTPRIFKRPDRIERGRFYLEGKWQIDEEGFKLSESSGGLFIPFHASKVFVVIGSDSPGKQKAEIRIDGKALSDADRGKDVPKKKSAFVIKDPGLYEIVDLQKRPGDHDLEIQFLEAGEKIYALKFE